VEITEYPTAYKNDFSPVLYTRLMPRHSTDTNLSQHEIDVLKRREQHGWFVNLISGDTLGPGFAYSFGL
jgi:hypothetical protein